jgi:FSR family fosmidomycin resistance protein-like MFS transporter
VLAALLEMPSLLQPLIGHVADRLDLSLLVFLCPAVTAIMMSLVGAAPNYGILALLLIMAGVSRAAFHAVGPAVAGRLSGRRLGRGMGIWMVGGQLGPALGPILVVSAVQARGLQGLTWLAFPGLVGSLLLYLRLRKVPVEPPSASGPRIGKETLGTMAPMMLLLVGTVSVRSFMAAGLDIFLPVYMTERGADLWTAGIALSLLQGAGTFGSLLSGALSDRWGRRATLLAAFLAGPALMIWFLHTDAWARMLPLLLLGLTTKSTMAVSMALVQESFPDHRALANSLFLSVTFVIRSLVGVVVGGLGDRFGLHWTFTASAAVFMLGVPLVMLLPTAPAADTTVA